jgi:pimeloyl-ACP methyl ester carboxylesterase
MRAMFVYELTPLRPVIQSREEGGRGWQRETVAIDAAYNQERLIIHLDLPTDCDPPYKTVIYFPGGNALYQPEFSRNFLWEPWDAIPKSGRALISPIYSGTFERGGGKSGRTEKKSSVQWFYERLNDLRRSIDYLETRPDLDTENIAFLGVCWGGAIGPVLAAYEERIKALVLVSGCIRMPVSDPKPKGLVQPLVTIPVLMLNGKYDYVFPLKTHQKPLFDLLGTPPEHKRHVIYDCGHLPLPRAPMLKEIFAWLDKYQGPVERNGKANPHDQIVKTDH